MPLGVVKTLFWDLGFKPRFGPKFRHQTAPPRGFHRHFSFGNLNSRGFSPWFSPGFSLRFPLGFSPGFSQPHFTPKPPTKRFSPPQHPRGKGFHHPRGKGFHQGFHQGLHHGFSPGFSPRFSPGRSHHLFHCGMRTTNGSQWQVGKGKESAAEPSSAL